MVAVYIVAAEGTGKTTFCAGLGRYLLGKGKKVSFIKLTTDDGNSADAAFMKQVLGLPETVASLCSPASDVNRTKDTYDRAAAGKDVVILEGPVGPAPEDSTSKAACEIARALKARVIALDAYAAPPSSLINSFKGFGDNLLGIVINKVPCKRLERVQHETPALFAGVGPILGFIPEDRTLLTLTIGELAECLAGKILNNTEKANELIENVMLGAMVVDSGLDYFGRKTNKAAVIRNNRPDMQLAALETSTRCLVLSGSNESPIYSVLQRAEKRGIPVILTEKDTSGIVTSLEERLSKNRFNQEKKLPRIIEIMHHHLNLQAVV